MTTTQAFLLIFYGIGVFALSAALMYVGVKLFPVKDKPRSCPACPKFVGGKCTLGRGNQ